MNIDWTDLFLSSTGRLARGPFLLAIGLLIGATAIYEAVVGPTLHWLTGWFIYPGLLFCGACVLSKRLHDRGRSGWWAALILIAFVAAWPYPTRFFDFLFCLVLLWSVIELGVMPGEQGANRFGPNPLKTQIA
ncbi:DUF805 domain-containing protein [Caulobacter segnis]|uniref:DUF805 domain-containing protein n=1 Tax=Caulobacter segnis TaxID=88688 RepID=UPI00240F01AC|nr:DUF805 domain-containing protein [Caulobacter segnis]MDG2522989.1 DUF805 domain-containing protein [Caulobacter segnis]